MTSPFRTIQVIANPASGKAEPVLAQLNHVFKDHSVDWQIDITHQKGDGAALARSAIEAGVDLIAAYGGDGTVGDIASGMIGSTIPLAILPGGTGNALAKGLAIPVPLQEAAEKIFSSKPQPIDMGRANGQTFILRADMGLTTSTTRDASQESKERLGMLAYLAAAIQSLDDIQPVEFHLAIDGQLLDATGIACIITNHYELGGFGLKFSDSVRPDDGKLDAFIIHDVGAVLALITAPLTQRDPDEVLDHYQGGKFRIEADTPQAFHLDGDPAGEMPVEIEVIPQAVQILVPEEVEGESEN